MNIVVCCGIIMGNSGDLRFLRNLDWNLMKTFAEIVRSGGVSKAARAMHRQQPSVSSALKRLEDYLGVVLCHRGPSGFELTDHGKAVAEVCSRIEEETLSLPGTFDEIAGELMFQVRLLVVGNLVSKRLDTSIARFSKMYPRSELLINVAPCTEIEERIVHFDAEIGVAPVPCANDALRFDFLYREQHVPVCGKDHHLFGKVITAPKDLSEEAFVLPGIDEAVPVRSYRERYGWGRNFAGQSLDLNEVKRMVSAGLGVSLLPKEFLQSEIDSGQMWPLMAPQAELQDDIYIVTNPANPRTIAVTKFLELLPHD